MYCKSLLQLDSWEVVQIEVRVFIGWRFDSSFVENKSQVSLWSEKAYFQLEQTLFINLISLTITLSAQRCVSFVFARTAASHYVYLRKYAKSY